MTAPTTAALVAEALEHAEDAVPQSIGRRHDQYVVVDEDRDIDDSGWGLTMMVNEQHVSTKRPRVVYVRHDAMLAALAHLAARVVAAEAERDGFQDALVLARAQAAKAMGYTERALAAGEALAARVVEAEERAGRAEAAAKAWEKDTRNARAALVGAEAREDFERAAAHDWASRLRQAEAALDAAEREASLRLDRVNVLRLGFEEGHPVLAVDDATASDRVRKYGPMAVTVDRPGGFAFVGHTGDTYAEGRAIREATSVLNPGARVRLWRLVLVEDWYRLLGEDDAAKEANE